MTDIAIFGFLILALSGVAGLMLLGLRRARRRAERSDDDG
jgi:hypothetical protein